MSQNDENYSRIIPAQAAPLRATPPISSLDSHRSICSGQALIIRFYKTEFFRTTILLLLDNIELADAAQNLFDPTVGTEGQRHVTPFHEYVALRLTLEGGFLPEEITPSTELISNEMTNERARLGSEDPQSGGAKQLFSESIGRKPSMSS